MKILGYYISDKTIVNSEGEVCGLRTPLEFLLESKLDTIRMLYDLNHCVLNLSSMLGINYSKLSEATKLDKAPYHLRFIPNKLFSVKKPGAFSYYADASQYIKYPDEGLRYQVDLPPLVLATRAKEVGDKVYKVLTELGLEVTSLTSPIRAYEKTQLKWLCSEREKAVGDEVKVGIIDGIGSGIFGNRWEKYLKEDLNGQALQWKSSLQV